MAAEWEDIAAVIRSEIHHPTWVALIPDCDIAATMYKCGPQRAVKAAVVEYFASDGSLPNRWRWRRSTQNLWVLEVVSD